MEESTPLKISHDVSQSLQRKFEGFSEVERAFVHVDYETEHDKNEEHKPLFDKKEKKEKKEKKPRKSLKDMLFSGKKKTEEELRRTEMV